MVDEADDLLARQLEREELVEQAEGGGDDATAADAAHAAAHARQAGRSPAALLPRLQM